MDVTQALLGEHGIVHLLVEQLDEALDRHQTTAELKAASEPLAITLLGHARIEEVMFKAARDAIEAGELQHLGHHWAEFRGVMLRE